MGNKVLERGRDGEMMDGKQVRPFGLRDKIGYLFGDFGNDFTFIFAVPFSWFFI